MKRYLTILLVVVIGLTACGESDEPSDETTTEAPATTTTEGSATTAAAAPNSDGNAGGGAQEGDVVRVHYTGTLDDGSEFDSSRGRDPLEFTVGSDQVIAGFDAAVRGLSVGDVTTVRIPPEEAYGLVDEELIFEVPIEEAPEDVTVGLEVLIGGVVTGRVIEITDTQVVIDTNHRFAGQALTFEIEVVSINE